MRKHYYIIFVAREEDGRLRKIPVPLRYAYVFLAAAVVGAFTITGMAGSYSRMLLKTASFNQVRSQREALRQDYKQLAQVAHEKDVQAASLGSLASEVTALYGLRQSNQTSSKKAIQSATAPVISGDPDNTDTFNTQDYTQSLDQLASLKTIALSGGITSRLGIGLSPAITASWVNMADAPSLWPVTGRITSSFGERQDPFNGEGAFHAGIDIAATFGEPVRATANGVVEKAGLGTGYGREVILNHGYGITTLYAHLSGYAVTPGEQVMRGQIIGYVGMSGRSTGPHLHYEVRIHDTPVNPHRYLRETMVQMASAAPGLNNSRGN